MDTADIATIDRAIRGEEPVEVTERYDTDILLRSVAQLMQSPDPVGAGPLIEHLLEQESAPASQAQLLFWLAQYYELPEARDYQRALMHYEELQRRFPFHELADQAGIRSRYLRRHFIDIR